MNLSDGFAWDINPGRIVFGSGASSRIGDELEKLGASRALVLSTPGRRKAAEAMAADLGGLSAGVFAEAVMHTPVEVTERAMAAFDASGADATVALGGGSTVGLGKAIALRNDCLQITIPTTYSGSEVTAVVGQTENGIKTTVKAPAILPEVVIYDPDLTLNLPVPTSVASALNAMAHSVEALYAKDRNPFISHVAVEGIRALRDALPVIVKSPQDPDARAGALYGAWLCGAALGAVGMSLHHKLAHTLGGSFGLPHAETHAALLPHTAAYNEAVARDLLRPAADLFGGDLGGGLYDFAVSLGSPRALSEFGLKEADLDRAAAIAVENPYWNPREIQRDAIRDLLDRAWRGERPQQ